MNTTLAGNTARLITKDSTTSGKKKACVPDAEGRKGRADRQSQETALGDMPPRGRSEKEGRGIMSSVLTLCPECVRAYESGFRVGKIQTATTTEKKKQCERCKRKFPADILGQFTVTARRR